MDHFLKVPRPISKDELRIAGLIQRDVDLAATAAAAVRDNIVEVLGGDKDRATAQSRIEKTALPYKLLKD